VDESKKVWYVVITFPGGLLMITFFSTEWQNVKENEKKWKVVKKWMKVKRFECYQLLSRRISYDHLLQLRVTKVKESALPAQAPAAVIQRESPPIQPPAPTRTPKRKGRWGLPVIAAKAPETPPPTATRIAYDLLLQLRVKKVKESERKWKEVNESVLKLWVLFWLDPGFVWPPCFLWLPQHVLW
jgi:hypothetical protein